MSTSPDSARRLSRRGFIQGLTVTGVAAMTVGTQNAQAADTATVTAARPTGKSGGYRKTPHVQRYYRLAREI